MIDTTMIHIGEKLIGRPESDKRSGMDFQDLVDTPQKVDTGWDRGFSRCISHILRGSSFSDRR